MKKWLKKKREAKMEKAHEAARLQQMYANLGTIPRAHRRALFDDLDITHSLEREKARRVRQMREGKLRMTNRGVV